MAQFTAVRKAWGWDHELVHLASVVTRQGDDAHPQLILFLFLGPGLRNDVTTHWWVFL